MNPQSQSSKGTSQLDATLNTLQGGLAAGAGAAGPAIAGWLKTLQGAPQLAAVSTELQHLYDMLRSGVSDTGALAHSLHVLGEHTTQAADAATPDAQAKLRQLGQALGAAAGQLRG